MNSKIFLFLILFFTKIAAEQFDNVRVLLAQSDDAKKITWHIGTDHAFLLTDAHRSHKKYGQKNSIITAKHGKWIINGKPTAEHILRIQPLKNALIHIENRSYQGSLLLIYKNRRYYLINEIALEDYLYSVVRWESWPGWPIEVNKAFAIASRSYVIFKMQQARKQNKLYHIKNTNRHQTYNGMHNQERIKKAIAETRGLILTYNNQPIEAMFDSCCGGIIAAKVSYVDFEKAPYLARSYPCTFCKTCKIYAYHAQYCLQEFEQFLKKADYAVGKIKQIVVAKLDAAGTVQEVIIRHTHGRLHLTGHQFYSLVPAIKSFCYEVNMKNNNIAISGRGYGHHVGICQWGAKNMVDAGWHYRAILAFYYPGTKIMALC